MAQASGTGSGGRGGASRSNPRWLERRIQSWLMRFLSSPVRTAVRRSLAEGRRRRRGEPHRVEYFHQVADPYSHLAAQVLERLACAYEIELAPQLADPAQDRNTPEPELLATYARKDAADIAPHYGLTFPRDAPAPSPEQVRLAERILVGAGAGFAPLAVEVGAALWSDDKERLQAIAARHAPADEATTRRRAAEGHARRQKLGHYAGAMFHYAGEWYWGVDRLHHLERRLDALGARRPGARVPVAPRPVVEPGTLRDTGALTLEFFPSLRSPYTAIVYDRTLALARRTGVRLRLRPVLPMVMRGVPATLAKGLYIFTDARREAELDGVDYGRMIDPIGPPVERAFSLFPWAVRQGRGGELLGAFLRAAFAEGIDTSRDAGLRHVVEVAGLDWEEARGHLGEPGWRELLEANRVTMYEELGVWGVPSYRVQGPEGTPDFATWGQDRLWLVARELRERIARVHGAHGNGSTSSQAS